MTIKNYNETDALKVIKDLLNLMCTDTKRYAGLLNKFKRSIDKVTIIDGSVTKVSFKDVDVKVLNEELKNAIVSLETYVGRSVKKMNEFLDILDLKGYSKEPTKKVTAKKVTAKKEPAKKVTAKKEPAKKVTAKKEPAKKVTAKKEPAKKDDTELKIAAFVNSLSDKKRAELLNKIREAFKNDSKLSTTMNNWLEKSSNFEIALIGMFKSSITRKPNNTLLKDWYSTYYNFVEKVEDTKVEDTKVEDTKVEDTKVEDTKVEDTKVEDTKVEEIVIYKGLLSKKLFTESPRKFSFNVNPALLRDVYAHELPNVYMKSNSIPKDKIREELEKYLEITNLTEDEALSFEGIVFEKTVKSKYQNIYVFGNTFLNNLIAMLNESVGFDSKLKAYIKEDSSFNITNYSEKTMHLTLLQMHLYNRKLIRTLINKVLEKSTNHDDIIKLFNLIGEIVLNVNGYGDEYEKQDTKDAGIKYNITATEISFIFENTSFIIQKSDQNYAKIYAAILSNDLIELKKLVITENSIKENIKSFLEIEDNSTLDIGEIKIIDKKIFYKDKIFKGKLSLELMKYIAENNLVQINKFKNFIHASALNPSSDSVEELYDFVVANNLKVTSSGTVILYKWVKDTYYDAHSNKFLNKPGLTIFMDRNKVNDNRNETCSNGLHLCSYNYTKFASRLLLCEVHPKNVVSIPTDYNKSKMRCCEYTVLLDITEYVSIMDTEGDILRKTENLHYNSKLLEIELLKLYPSVKRINSINGFNNMQGKSEKELLEIAFGNHKIEEELKPESFEKININFEENEEEIVETEPMVAVETAAINSTEEKTYPPFNIYFKDYLNDKDVGNLNEINLEDAKIFLRDSKVIDRTVLDSVEKLTGLVVKNINNLDELLTIISNYKQILNNELSSTEFDNKHKDDTVENLAKDVENNNDEVKVVERPSKEDQSIMGKAKSFLKKLF